jgi:hypothetical protein
VTCHPPPSVRKNPHEERINAIEGRKRKGRTCLDEGSQGMARRDEHVRFPKNAPLNGREDSHGPRGEYPRGFSCRSLLVMHFFFFRRLAIMSVLRKSSVPKFLAIILYLRIYRTCPVGGHLWSARLPSFRNLPFSFLLTRPLPPPRAILHNFPHSPPRLRLLWPALMPASDHTGFVRLGGSGRHSGWIAHN